MLAVVADEVVGGCVVMIGGGVTPVMFAKVSVTLLPVLLKNMNANSLNVVVPVGVVAPPL